MKKYILLVLLIGFLIVIPFFGHTTTTKPLVDVPTISLNIWELLGNALKWFFNIVLILAAIMIVYSGYQYITAAGDAEKTQKALNSLIFALIGIGIALLANGLISIVKDFLGVTLN